MSNVFYVCNDCDICFLWTKVCPNCGSTSFFTDVESDDDLGDLDELREETED